MLPSSAVGQDDVKTSFATIIPLQTARLKPIRQRTKNAVISITESGCVYLELLRCKDGCSDRVQEVLVISPDGQTIQVYQPSRGTVVDDERPAAPPAGISGIQSFSLSSLPNRYAKRYDYAARFISLIASKTPKVIIYTHHAKCLLMENTPDADFDVFFYDGCRFSYGNGRSVFHLAEGGDVIELTESGAWNHLSPSVQQACQYASQTHEHCLRLERLLYSMDESTKDMVCFPVIVGRRPTTLEATALSPFDSADVANSSEGYGSGGNSSPAGEKTLCSSPSAPSARCISSSSDDDMFDRTLVPQTPQRRPTSLAARHRLSERRRSRSLDVSVSSLRPPSPAGFSHNGDPREVRSCPSSPLLATPPVRLLPSLMSLPKKLSPRSPPASPRRAPEVACVSPCRSEPEMVVLTATAPEVVNSVVVPGVGRSILLSNGVVVVKFKDLSELSIQSAPSLVVTYRETSGVTSLYEETDSLPSDVKKKLEVLPYVMTHLEAVQATKPRRVMER